MRCHTVLITHVGQLANGFSRLVLCGDGVGTGSAKHHKVEKGVGTQAVGTVDRGTAGLPRSIQAWHHLVLHTVVCDHL